MAVILTGATLWSAHEALTLLDRTINTASQPNSIYNQSATKSKSKKKPVPNTNPFDGPVDGEILIGDGKGNIIPVPQGYQLGGSIDGEFIQLKDKDGKANGTRKDGKGHPVGPSHTDPRSHVPHGHVPGVSNADGTPWLPIYY